MYVTFKKVIDSWEGECVSQGAERHPSHHRRASFLQGGRQAAFKGERRKRGNTKLGAGGQDPETGGVLVKVWRRVPPLHRVFHHGGTQHVSRMDLGSPCNYEQP